jgi:hypothetical protein
MLPNGFRLPTECAGMSLDFYQIYFEDEQRKECYDFAKPYRNDTYTDFFENSVIQMLVPASQAKYISVCSWRLKRKRQDGWVPVLSGFPGRPDDLTEEKILSHDFDVAVLTPRSKSHQMLANAAMWHGGPQHNYAWDNAIKELKTFIKVPDEVKTPIYENHFIATKELYHEYVTNFLNPVIEYMSGRDCFFTDSGYAVKKERDRQGGKEAVQRYRDKTGRSDWPIAPFILERLFSIFINDKKLKIINL